MASVTEQIMQQLRAWCVAELGVADEQVMLASRGPEPGPHVVEPSLIIDFTTPGVAQGVTWREQRGTTQYTFAQYLGVVELTAYGLEAGDWLAQLALESELAGFVGFDLVDTGTTFDASQPTATGIQQIYVREWQVAYAIRTERTVAPGATVITVTPTTLPPTT